MARRALLVGLNAYPNPANRLRGCLNDVRQMSALLREHFGFADTEGVRTLTDARATTAGIKSGLEWLASGARAGDVLVFHYSGHGSQVPDRHGDEATDGLDEIICPYDLNWDAPFTDDDLHAIVQHIPAGANLTVVLDCCHAGTGLRDLRPAESVSWRCLEHPSAAAAGGRGFAGARVRRFGERAAVEGAILVAACRDDQVSADAFIDGDYHGALTYYLCQALRDAGYAATYSGLVRALRRLLRGAGFEQEPQLEGPAAARRVEVFGELIETAV